MCVARSEELDAPLVHHLALGGDEPKQRPAAELDTDQQQQSDRRKQLGRFHGLPFPMGSDRCFQATREERSRSPSRHYWLPPLPLSKRRAAFLTGAWHRLVNRQELPAVGRCSTRQPEAFVHKWPGFKDIVRANRLGGTHEANRNRTVEPSRRPGAGWLGLGGTTSSPLLSRRDERRRLRALPRH